MWKEDRLGGYVDIRVDDRTRGAVLALNMPHEVLIEDVQAQIDAQVANRKSEVKINNEFFEDYHTYDEISEFVSGLVAQYPSLLTPVSLGTTYEGRSISGVRLAGRSPTKAVVFNGGQHAREWITPATVTGILYNMVTSYGNDTVVTDLIDNIDFTIVPVLNPDGYSYTWTNDRLWRKNRQPIDGATCVGIDTNRNWEFQWNTGGSSTQPCSDTYCGPEPFAAIEAECIDTYIRGLKAEGLNVLSYFDVHAYSQYWMFPWGYTCNSLTPDHDDLNNVAAAAVASVRAAGYNTVFTYGSICNVIYQASGSSVDHTYGALGVKYSYALELRDTGRYGFQLPAEQIVESIEETYAGFLDVFAAVRNE